MGREDMGRRSRPRSRATSAPGWSRDPPGPAVPGPTGTVLKMRSPKRNRAPFSENLRMSSRSWFTAPKNAVPTGVSSTSASEPDLQADPPNHQPPVDCLAVSAQEPGDADEQQKSEERPHAKRQHLLGPRRADSRVRRIMSCPDCPSRVQVAGAAARAPTTRTSSMIAPLPRTGVFRWPRPPW